MKLFILLFLLISYPSLQAQEPKKSTATTPASKQTEQALEKSTETGTDTATTKEIIRSKSLPYITIINAENLVSYKWWEAKSKKVPEVYKDILKKIMAGLKEESVALGFSFVTTTDLSAETIQKLMDNGVGHLITGKLIFDVDKPEEFILKDLKVSSFKDPNEIFLQANDQDITTLDEVQALGKKMGFQYFRKENYVATPEKPHGFIRFETTLTYLEIEKIMDQIKTDVQGVESIKIHSFTGDEVTFAITPLSVALLQKVSELHFLKGPYKTSVAENTLTLMPYKEEDFGKTNDDQN